MIADGFAIRAGLQRSQAAVLGGVALCMALAGVAVFAAPYAHVPAMLIVLVLGMAVRASAGTVVAGLRPGVDFAAKRLLRIGVALLGLRIVAGDLMELGWRAGVLIVTTLTVTVVSGYLIARLFRLPSDTASIAATSVAVCGASAALAASAMAPPREGLDRDTTIVIVVVSLLSTAAMVLYPLITHMLGYDGLRTSLLLGGAIHDVAQVVGAGFAISPEVGVRAVAAKLMRVACLLPVAMAWGMFHMRTGKQAGGTGARPTIPAFLIAFLVLAALSSAGLVPKLITDVAGVAASWTLATAVGAIGLKTAIGDLRAAQPALAGAMIVQSLVQLVAVMIAISVLFG